MSKITYANKVALYENSDIADINKVTADDMNEIKDCVNNNDDMLTGGEVAGNMVVESMRTKNMFDMNNVLVGQLLKTYGDGGTEANADWNSSYYIAVKPNTTYTYTTVNPGTTTNQIIINQYNGTTFVTGSQYNQTGGGTFSHTFTTGSTTTNVRLGYRNANNYQNIQLEEGSTATAYTPYQLLDYPSSFKIMSGKENTYGISYNVYASGKVVTIYFNNNTFLSQLNQGTIDYTIFTLPVGYRPLEDIKQLISSNYGHRFLINIGTDGRARITYVYQALNSSNYDQINHTLTFVAN